jgi:hypothetical protein
LPIIAITYFLVLTVDFMLLWLSVRSGKKQLALAPHIPMEHREQNWLQYGGDGSSKRTNTSDHFPYPLSQSPTEKYFDSKSKTYHNPYEESTTQAVEGAPLMASDVHPQRQSFSYPRPTSMDGRYRG